jgi:hypothetical protein
MSSSPKPDEGEVPQVTPDEQSEHQEKDLQTTGPGMDDHEVEVKEQDRWLPIANGTYMSSILLNFYFPTLVVCPLSNHLVEFVLRSSLETAHAYLCTLPVYPSCHSSIAIVPPLHQSCKTVEVQNCHIYHGLFICRRSGLITPI